MRKILFFVYTALLVSLTLFVTACSSGEEQSKQSIPQLIQPVTVSVNTAFVDKGPVVYVERHEGITRLQSQPLNFGGIGENFSAFYVFSGERVTAGQLLARLDCKHLSHEIEYLTEKIAYLNALTVTDADSRERHNLTLRHAIEDLNELLQRLEAYALHAPFDGIITLTADIQSGQWLTPWETVLYIAAEQEVFIEYMGGRLQVPPPAQTLRAEVITGEIDGVIHTLQQVPITREKRAEYAARGQSVPIRFTVPGVNLRLGAFVSIMLYTHRVDETLRIPINALFNGPDGETFVYRIINGVQVHTPFIVGVRTPVFAEVLEHLAEGDEVFVRP